jgi:hypothetical protein
MPKVRRQASTMIDGRTDARHLDGARMEYTHRQCGRTYVIDHSKKQPGQKRPWTEAAAKFYAKYWSGSPQSGGCIAVCPLCVKDGRRR